MKRDLHETCGSRIFNTGDTDICQEEIYICAQFKIALVLELQYCLYYKDMI